MCVIEQALPVIKVLFYSFFIIYSFFWFFCFSFRSSQTALNIVKGASLIIWCHRWVMSSCSQVSLSLISLSLLTIICNTAKQWCPFWCRCPCIWVVCMSREDRERILTSWSTCDSCSTIITAIGPVDYKWVSDSSPAPLSLASLLSVSPAVMQRVLPSSYEDR